MKISFSALASLFVAVCLAFTLFAPPAAAQTDDTYPITLPFVREATPADLLPADDSAADAAAAGDEVLGVSVSADAGAAGAAPELAFTGSNVDTTALIGAALIGSGALATLASRKRRLRDGS